MTFFIRAPVNSHYFLYNKKRIILEIKQAKKKDQQKAIEFLEVNALYPSMP